MLNRLRVLLLSVVICCVFLYYSLRYVKNFQFGSEQPLALHPSDGCDLPHLDPWDKSILPYILKQAPLKCEQVQYELTRLDKNGTLYVDGIEILKSGLTVKCFYRCYGKTMGDDKIINYEEWKSFKDPFVVNCDFVETYCRRTAFPRSTVYSNNHNQVVPRKNIRKRVKNEFRPSVILFVLDSVSHSSWRRNLPKTYEALKSDYQSFIFDGMNKVGDQSFPNAVAFLTGENAKTEFGDVSGFFDNHSLIWKDFEAENYSTYYAEDYPDYNLFYYLANGFRDKPVHHYFRPYWLNVYGSYVQRRSTNLCYGTAKMHNLQLNYLSSLLHRYKDSPVFALNWLTELAHDYMNVVQIGDEDIATFFREHREILKDSFLFVMSDHGHRFDSIRGTAVGRQEERLPFFSLQIPATLRRKYPRLDDVVRRNAQVLTTFWDVYVTLRDILHLTKTQNWNELASSSATSDSELQRRFSSYSTRGTSLLRPIPIRSCAQASVPEEFCACTKEKAVKIHDPNIQNGARQVVAHLNAFLAPHKRCAQLSLARVTYAAQQLEETSTGPSSRYRITLEVSPSRALFDALVEHDATRDASLSVVGEVNRINRYGNQSICIGTQELRKYCFCL